LLVGADWPGNVRELENVIESALALARGPRLRMADLQVRRPQMRALVAPAAEMPLSLAAYERAVIERALRENGGEASAAARCLGIGRSTFYRKLSRHGIQLGKRGGGSGLTIR